MVNISRPIQSEDNLEPFSFRETERVKRVRMYTLKNYHVYVE